MLPLFDKLGVRYLKITEDFKADLNWWRHFASSFNGCARILDTSVLQNIQLFCDSSGTGFGAWFGADWLFGSWTSPAVVHTNPSHGHYVGFMPSLRGTPISVRELYPVLLSVLRWGQLWRDSKITVFSDNKAVCYAINKGVSDNPISMNLLRELFWYCVFYNCHLVAIHIPGRLNFTADRLSRLCQINFIPPMLCCSTSNI